MHLFTIVVMPITPSCTRGKDASLFATRHPYGQRVIVPYQHTVIIVSASSDALLSRDKPLAAMDNLV